MATLEECTAKVVITAEVPGRKRFEYQVQTVCMRSVAPDPDAMGTALIGMLPRATDSLSAFLRGELKEQE